jgi:hypothetical protein
MAALVKAPPGRGALDETTADKGIDSPIRLLGMGSVEATVELFKVIADDMKAVARVIASLDGQANRAVAQ